MKRKKPLVRKVPLRRKAFSKKGNKFGAVKSKSRVFPDRMFDSKGERLRAEHLHLLQRLNHIRDLEFQPRVKLSEAEVTYKPDFSYVEGGVLYYEDFKGVETGRFRVVCKLWGVYGPAPLRVTKAVYSPRTGVKFTIAKTIYPPASPQPESPDAGWKRTRDLCS